MTRVGAVRIGTTAALALVLWSLIEFAGAPLGSALRGWWIGAAGDAYAAGETLVVALPLALVALGAVPSLRAGFMSVGAEGQLAVGALTATTSLLAIGTAPRPVYWLVGVITGAVGGAAWALLPVWLRVRRGVSEVLTTLLMNYLGVALVTYVLALRRTHADASPTPHSQALPAAALLPNVWPATRLHAGVLLVVLATAALGAWQRSSGTLLYEVRSGNPPLGRRLGLSEARAAFASLTLAGAAAGVAGWMQVAGLQGTLYPSVGGGIGFLGLLAALLGRLRPLGILAAAVLFGALANGADGMQTESGVPASVATVCQGALLLMVALALASKPTAPAR